VAQRVVWAIVSDEASAAAGKALDEVDVTGGEGTRPPPFPHARPDRPRDEAPLPSADLVVYALS